LNLEGLNLKQHDMIQEVEVILSPNTLLQHLTEIGAYPKSYFVSWFSVLNLTS
jgi:hypothetical protein